MEWYIPITFLPAIGLLILSSSNLLIALNDELDQLKKNNHLAEIYTDKVLQLKRLTLTLNTFYIAASFFTISALIGAFSAKFNWTLFSMDYITLTLGVFITLLGLLLLVVYSFKAVSVRQRQYEIENGEDEN
jgi:hypothetical protein